MGERTFGHKTLWLKYANINLRPNVLASKPPCAQTLRTQMAPAASTDLGLHVIENIWWYLRLYLPATFNVWTSASSLLKFLESVMAISLLAWYCLIVSGLNRLCNIDLVKLNFTDVSFIGFGQESWLVVTNKCNLKTQFHDGVLKCAVLKVTNYSLSCSFILQYCINIPFILILYVTV